MLDMDHRMAPVRRRSLAVIALTLVASAPWLGMWTLVPLLAAGGFFKLAERLTTTTARPEYPIFAAWTLSQVVIAASIALTGGHEAPTLSWLAIPIVTLSARFSARGIAVGVAFTLFLLLAATFGVDAGAVIDYPPRVLGAACVIVAVAMLSVALMQSDVEHRSESVIDQLTGMLNRKALATRVKELEEQAAVTGAAIGVIVADLDRFKNVNDLHGHAAGDAVLKDVAYVIRKRLRAYDLAYRLGGEEFLVLVPGADIAESEQLAEHLRVAISRAPLGDGQSMTMSLGVSASAAGSGFDYETTFAEADAALYEAKRSGRDCVVAAYGRARETAEPAALTT